MIRITIPDEIENHAVFVEEDGYEEEPGIYLGKYYAGGPEYSMHLSCANIQQLLPNIRELAEHPYIYVAGVPHLRDKDRHEIKSRMEWRNTLILTKTGVFSMVIHHNVAAILLPTLDYFLLHKRLLIPGREK